MFEFASSLSTSLPSYSFSENAVRFRILIGALSKRTFSISPVRDYIV